MFGNQYIGKLKLRHRMSRIYKRKIITRTKAMFWKGQTYKKLPYSCIEKRCRLNLILAIQ
jgi:hypothetical protein